MRISEKKELTAFHVADILLTTVNLLVHNAFQQSSSNIELWDREEDIAGDKPRVPRAPTRTLYN
jgi:hypothetical protein